jgi:hypothetical protein
MGHYAKVTDGVVQEVIVADAAFISTLDDAASWVKTSYNTRGGVHYAPNSNDPDDGVPIRKNYASIGMNYDGVGFYTDAPYESWSLNLDTYLWEPPIPRPERTQEEIDNSVFYVWDEETYQADNTQGWIVEVF